MLPVILSAEPVYGVTYYDSDNTKGDQYAYCSGDRLPGNCVIHDRPLSAPFN